MGDFMTLYMTLLHISLAIVFAVLGLIQFGFSFLVRSNDPNDRLVKAFRAWGRRALLYGLLISPLYFVREDVYVVSLVELFLLSYNGLLLRKALKK